MDYFSEEELKCKCGSCGLTKIDPIFHTVLNAIRETCGFCLPVTSGIRCPNYNNEVSKTGFDGPHVSGLAVDIGIYGEKAFKLIAIAANFPLISGIGVNQNGAFDLRFIHLDALSLNGRHLRPWIWSY